jgi:small subunit ribosomal protein S6
MEKYELLFILPAKYTETELAEMADKIKGIVTAAGASVTEAHDLGRRKLAYPVKGARNGNYFLFYFEAEAPVLAKLNEMLRLSTDILRHLVAVRDEHITKIPSFAEEEMRRERAEAAPAPRPLPPPPPQQAPLQAKEKITMEELDKKLDEILTDDIL